MYTQLVKFKLNNFVLKFGYANSVKPVSLTDKGPTLTEHMYTRAIPLLARDYHKHYVMKLNDINKYRIVPSC